MGIKMDKNILIKYNKKIFIIAIFMVSMLLISCNSQTNSTISSFDPPFEKGGTRFFYEGEGKVSPTSTIEKINGSQPYKAKVTVANYYPFENEYNLFVFIDYNLVDIFHRNKLTPSLDIGKLSSGETSVNQFSIKNIEEGKHELLVLLVRKKNTP
ncbi:hypothetical protein [Bacillus sp. Marseille-Q1617]|uniref:hypothetical protein n=1 Tax=Bacillus sp. Marseille-Q1617 TaxID=2736887 RepID=UPI00158D068A|nr:hypothetical protein [Bacillus sp. Marseille-Q1617]